MPFKQRTKKLIKNILNTDNNKTVNNQVTKSKLKLNKSYCNLAKKEKNS